MEDEREHAISLHKMLMGCEMEYTKLAFRAETRICIIFLTG